MLELGTYLYISKFIMYIDSAIFIGRNTRLQKYNIDNIKTYSQIKLIEAIWTYYIHIKICYDGKIMNEIRLIVKCSYIEAQRVTKYLFKETWL